MKISVKKNLKSHRVPTFQRYITYYVAFKGASPTNNSIWYRPT